MAAVAAALVLGLGLACGIGLAAGVGLNALADDLPPDELGVPRPLRPPHCAYCGAVYPRRHWLALGHWVLRRRRCARCGAPRSTRHGWVELLMGLCLAGLWGWARGAWLVFAPAAVLAFIFALRSSPKTEPLPAPMQT